MLSGPGCRKTLDPPRVTINNKTWYVECVRTVEGRFRGLSGRSYLGEDSGMLFIFGDSRVRTFCMRRCVIDLDIAFIDPNHRVVAIHTMRV
ncbi:MAG: DUF192 domain-containing protein, partial [Planctomycetota bacterium]